MTADTRVVVVGTSGAGKSTFASALARALDCPYVELDRHHWGPGWTPVPVERFAAAVAAATAGDRWVADGNYRAIRDQLWLRATHIVWLIFSRRTVWSRVFVRTMRRVFFRTALSHGNRDSFRSAFLSHDSILLWSVTSFSRNRQKYARLREDPSHAHLHWTELTHPSQAAGIIEAFAGGASPAR